MANNAAAIADRLQEVKQEIAEKCAQDSGFRSSLMADPTATVEAEYGLEKGTLGDVHLNVVVEEPGSIVLPIPPDMSEIELTDEQLDQVAGGAAFIGAVGAIAGAVSATAAAGAIVQRTRAGRRW
jgi:hypothetical protein